ncbi:hypothetical protein OYC64_016156 [Pagothenia borchgrevinki]|uniref:Uncharacterized protein n=1 Tax=Pagothenia borchgrevinki TaxID=8213 RepID=A0ABD2HI39_PAGBO
MPKKNIVKSDQSGEPGPKEASGSTNEEASGVAGRVTDDSSILGAIAALHAELTLVKSEICRKIETEISEVTTTLRGEITALKAEKWCSDNNTNSPDRLTKANVKGANRSG